MIKTFIHNIEDFKERDREINLFSIENKVFATQTNNFDGLIITTLFFDTKSR